MSAPAVPGREADDYAGVLMRWSNGARGTMWVTNAAAGAEHGLAFRIFGARAGSNGTRSSRTSCGIAGSAASSRC